MNIEKGEEVREKDIALPSQEIKERPLVRKSWGEILKEKISQFTEAMGFSRSPKELEEKMEEEIDLHEKEYIIEGVNFSRCQPEKIVKEKKAGKKIEVETFSPYLSDYNTVTGEIWKDKLINSDKIGLAIGKVLRRFFPKARMISLYDEYNSGMPDSDNEEDSIAFILKGKDEKEKSTVDIIKEKDLKESIKEEKELGKDKYVKRESKYLNRPTKNLLKGAPHKEPGMKVGQIKFSEEAKDNFYKNIEQLLRDEDIIRNNDKAGENYLLISESSKIEDAKKLVEKLEENNYIRRKGEEIYFINDKAENQNYKEIQLRTKDGRWLCEALDSSAFIKKENLDTTHLVVLPNSFKEQQDKVWEILKVLGIKPDNYHNIFFDKNMDPKKVAEIIEREFKKYS